LAAINCERLLRADSCIVPPPTTALGSLVQYVTDRRRRDFQPMNANYGLFPPLDSRERGQEKRFKLAARAERDLERWIREHQVDASDAYGASSAAREIGT
jgi:methylenetetrahydrofolate--tRNA-(uracil-5-)-methyltransferase